MVPIMEGVPVKLPHSNNRYDVSGIDLTNYMLEMQLKQNRPFSILSRSDFNCIREIKEKYCFVAPNFQQKMTSGAIPKIYKLPDGQTISIGKEKERFKIPEAMFQPSLIGRTMPGLPVFVYDMINKCKKEERKIMFENIVLGGGNTLFSGFEDRLRAELLSINNNINLNIINISREENRKNLSWLGGSILASLSTWRGMGVSKKEYEEFGASIFHQKDKTGYF